MSNKNENLNEASLLLANENLKIVLPYIAENLKVFKKCLLAKKIFSEEEITKMLIEYEKIILSSGEKK